MDGRTLLVILDSVYLLALVAWLGAILFFSFGIAPVIFRVLEPEQASRFVRALFPRYYAWGATAGSIGLAAYTAGVLAMPEYRGPAAAVQMAALLLGSLAMLYSGNVLTPAINAARDAGPDQAARFDRLHRRSVRLNAAVLVALAALVVAFAARPTPTSRGIVDPAVR